MSDTTIRDALEREVAGYLPMLSADELRVLSVQMRRMIRIGRDKYGPLDLSKEKRDWHREMAAESSDRLFYEACAEVARVERKRERVERFITADRHDDWEDLTSEFHRSAASSGESPTPCDTPPTSEDAAPIRLNKLDRACSECEVGVGEEHSEGCGWVTQVPGAEGRVA